MKSTLTSVLAAIALGVAGGATLGYWEARPWAAGVAAKTDAVRPAATDGSPGPAGDPQAVVPETTFKFGNMETGAVQRHEFPIRNEGGAPLTVNFVSHTCKCTEVQLDGKLVEPGASIVVAPHGKSEVVLQWEAKVAPGPFRHGATFTTNDAALDRLEITVEGEIVASTTLSPAELSFGSVRVGEPGKSELVVLSFLEPEVEIISHEVTDAHFAEHVDVSFEPVPADQLPDKNAKAGVRVTATYDPHGELGPFTGSLKLHTNIAKAADLVVPLYGTVKGDIWMNGAGWTQASGVLRLGNLRSTEGGKSDLQIMIRGEHAADTTLTVESVTPPELKATLGEARTLRPGLISVPLVVEVPAGTRPMARAGEDLGGEGEIVLATTHPVTPKVRMRVTFAVVP
jgi:hypothetical protein